MPTDERGERLQVIIAHAGLASRRSAEALILQGRVRVNGLRVTQLGTRADPSVDRIEIDGVPAETSARPHAYILLYKPLGVVATAHDPEGRRTVIDLVRSDRRLYPAGRLDYDSEGLLLLTDDGALTHRLTQARYGVEKEYHVLAGGRMTEKEMRDLERGVPLDDGVARAVRASILRATPEGTWARIVLHEGRNRQVRRMLDAMGYEVARLRRVRVGPLSLGSLEPGRWRALTGEELRQLHAAVGLAPAGG